MRAVRATSLAVAALLASAACGGGGDGGGSSPTTTLDGTVLDYWSGLPVPSAAVGGGGQVGTTTADGTGDFSFATVPQNGGVELSASKAGYHSTRNESIPVGTTPVTADIYIAAFADIARQYAAVGVTAAVDSVEVIVTLDDAGTPREGLALSSIVLLDSGNDTVGVGPFVFGAAGDIVPTTTLNTTTAFGGRSRVAFLNVPVGRLTLHVEIPPPNAATLTMPVTGSTNGVVLVRR